MAEGKKSFILYADLIHTVSKLPKEKAGELFLHILEYVNDKNPTTDDLILQLAFEPVKLQLKRDLEKWDAIRGKRSDAGKVSANKRQQKQHMLTHVEFVEQTSTNVNTTQQTSTNPTVTVNVNDTVTVNDSVIEREPTLDYHASYKTVIEKTVDDEIFVSDSAKHIGVTEGEFIAWANYKLNELKISTQISRYTVATIRAILVKDGKKWILENKPKPAKTAAKDDDWY